MQSDLKSIQDSAQISNHVYKDSRKEADEIRDMYHNRQYAQAELRKLKRRGQPAETFNVIKLFSRYITGYYSTVLNAVRVFPKTSDVNNVLTATLINDTVDQIMRSSGFETEGDDAKLDACIAGYMVAYESIKDTGDKDRFGRTINEAYVEHVPEKECLLDPNSTKPNYSDAEFFHRWRWVTESTLKRMFPKKKAMLDKLEPYNNHLELENSEYESNYKAQQEGKYKLYSCYLLVHSCIVDDDGKRYSVFWCDDVELSRQEITENRNKFPYRVQKIYKSDKVEYYGIFREVYESQKAINQALLKIQTMANTQKVFLEKGAVSDIAKFTDQINRVNAIIEVDKLSKMQIENLSKDILDQYVIIDKALTRIKQVLGVNESFLGLAYASDSGRKVKIQQNQTLMAMRYLTKRIEQFYRGLGWDLVNIVQQFYTANQVVALVDNTTAVRWIELNKPDMIWTGEFDEQGQPIFDYMYREVLNPNTGEPETDEDGNILIEPIPTEDTEIAVAKVKLIMDTVAYNDEDEKNQLMMETVLQGPAANALLSVNPAGLMKIIGMQIKAMKTRDSIEISNIFMQTADMIQNQGNQLPPEEGEANLGESPKSPSLQIPQEG